MAFRYRKLLLFSLLISITDSLILLYWVHYRVKKISTVFSNGTQSASHSVFSTPKLKSDKRGYIALVYSSTARSFSVNFESHIVNLMAGCPYTVHLFLHTIKNDNRFVERLINSSHDNYLSVNATLHFFKGYINLDNERVFFHDAITSKVFEYIPLEVLRKTYRNTFDIAVKRFPGHPPIPNVYYMWHSQRRGEELRQQYITATGIRYKWTFRVRYDAVFYTNWWQRAFTVKVYNPLDPTHRSTTHDVSKDWGVRRTRLYDMVYEPRLRIDKMLYVPMGWAFLGYNDQFAAMSSVTANHYFMRILHVGRMLREGRIHPEISIHLVARWNNITVNDIGGTICYDIVHTSESSNHTIDNMRRSKQSCSYKDSGIDDCNTLCRQLEDINRALRDSFLHGKSVLLPNSSLDIKRAKSLLLHHLSHFNKSTNKIDCKASSFYYFYRYMTSKDVNDPCLPDTWSTDQSNVYSMQYLPFILQATDRSKIIEYNKHLTSGPSVNIWA